MVEVRYHATTKNRFYPDMSNVNKNITVETKLINPPTYIYIYIYTVYIYIYIHVCVCVKLLIILLVWYVC